MKTAIECWKSAGNNPDNYSQSVNEAMEEYRLQSHPSQTNDSGIRKLLDKIILKVVDEEVYLYPSISSLELNKILSEYPHPTPVMSAEQVEEWYRGYMKEKGSTINTLDMLKAFAATAPPANDERDLINNVTVGDIIKIRNYFGEHDLSPFEHRAYRVMDKLVDFFMPLPAPPNK